MSWNSENTQKSSVLEPDFQRLQNNSLHILQPTLFPALASKIERDAVEVVCILCCLRHMKLLNCCFCFFERCNCQLQRCHSALKYLNCYQLKAIQYVWVISSSLKLKNNVEISHSQHSIAEYWQYKCHYFSSTMLGTEDPEWTALNGRDRVLPDFCSGGLWPSSDCTPLEGVLSVAVKHE